MKKIWKCMMAGLLAVVTGCQEKEPGIEANGMDTSGLVGISFQYTNGMMRGEDYAFEIEKEEIVYAYFFDRSKEYSAMHVSLTEKQWEQISAVVGELLTFLEPLDPPESSEDSQTEDVIVLDEGSKDFSLTWLDENENEIIVSYSFPWEDRFGTLLDYLKEIVHPIHRTVQMADAPVLNGIEVSSQGSFLSLQDYTYTIRTSNEGKSWVLSDGKKENIELSKEEWEAFVQWIDQYQLETYPFSKEENTAVTLVYGYGHRKKVCPSNDVMEAICSHIEEMKR